MTHPVLAQVTNAWWPCDRCTGFHPGLDAEGVELTGPPAKLVDGEYLCGPCRGLGYPQMRQLIAGIGRHSVGTTRRCGMPLDEARKEMLDELESKPSTRELARRQQLKAMGYIPLTAEEKAMLRRFRKTGDESGFYVRDENGEFHKIGKAS